MSFLVSLPVPPSVNALYGNNKTGKGRGRYRTSAYKDWARTAGWEAKLQKPQRVSGPYKLFLILPNIRGDIGNFEKAVSDLLVDLNLIDNDQHAVDTRITKVPENRGFAVVSVEAV